MFRRIILLILASLISIAVNGQNISLNELIRLANSGLAEAQYNLGLKYYHGEEVGQSYTEALNWFRKAADQGLVEAQYNLGVMYGTGKGVGQSYSEAARWYRKAAEQGHADAQLNLGNKYYNGEGVEQSYNEAARWFRKAADQGQSDAQLNLGNGYYKGQGVGQSYTEALIWYRKAAEQGNVGGQHNLGVMYSNGEGVKQSYAEAASWYRKAAEQGNAESQYNLGVMYYEGLGVEQSYVEAARWYRKAADQGYAGSQHNLAVMYSKGQGVEQSDTEAVRWYRKAAEQGLATAQYSLGHRYFVGEGVEKSYTEARKWFMKAQKQFDENPNLDEDGEMSEKIKLMLVVIDVRLEDDSEASKSNNTSTSYSSNSYKPERRYRGPFNSPKWDRRPVGLSVGYVQKQWVYSARPEFIEKYGDVVEKYGIFLDDGHSSFNHGIQAGIRIEPLLKYGFGFDTGIYYEYYYEKSHTITDEDGPNQAVWNNHCVNVPLHLEYRLNFSNNFQIFVYGGASLDFDLSSTMKYIDIASEWVTDPYDLYDEEDNDLKRVNASWEAGAGIRINGIQIQGQMSMGLVDMASPGAEYKVFQSKPMGISISWMF